MDLEVLKILENQKISTIAIISNTHEKIKFPQIAISNSDYWETPMGKIQVDNKMSLEFKKFSSDIIYDTTHFINDPTVELILPMLQYVLKNNFKIIPIIFGNSFYLGEDIDNKYQKLAEALSHNLGENGLVIVSNDMVHWPTDIKLGKSIDSLTIQYITDKNLKAFELYEEKIKKENYNNIRILNCGRDGIKTAMLYFSLIGSGDIIPVKYELKKFKEGNFVGCSTIIFKQ
jgi:MEMO1 family protein